MWYEQETCIGGIGFFSGGMEALTEFIKNLEPGTGCAFVVVQHLSPDNSSLLTELLSRQTSLPVEVVDKDVKPQPDHVYITPPNHDIVYELGALVLKEPAEIIGPKPSVNRMLHSMAAAEDIFSVGIILSGTGTDGASGLAAIKPAVGIQWAGGIDFPASLAFASLVKFNVASLAGKTIDSATLNLETNSAPVGYYPQNFQIAAVAIGWIASTVTWNMMSSFQYYTNSWQTFLYPTYAGKTCSINLTATVQYWANGTYTNNGLGFLSTNYGYYPGNITSLDAYEFYIPTLTVTYH